MSIDSALWVIQIILFIKFISVAFTHGLRQGLPTMQQAIQKLGAGARPLLFAVAALELMLPFGLILPMFYNTLGWMAPVAAAALALMMAVSILLHLKSREKPQLLADVILLGLCAFTAYGRWVLAPL